ncbi:ABC transporter substrate-binding protein [Natronomonas amylolytica]|uniref:ABC transporter substrate-binding protein n=1 Tax=Natronomonas amylolytica TaxID=3108498 RepID=UPI003009CC7E
MVNNGKSSRTADETGYHGVDRRTFLKATGAGAAGTALAGCLGDGNGGGGGSNGLTVGHLGPMAIPLGVGSLRSAEMAAEKINENGGVNGGDVEIIEGDTQATPSEAQSVAEELIQQEDVDVLVGAFASEVALSLVDLTSQMDVPFIVTGSASVQVTRDNVGEDYEAYRNIFRTGPVNSALQAEAVAGHCEYLLNRQDWDKVAFLRDNAAWTKSFEELIPGLLDERGIDIVYDSALSINNPDLGSVMDEVAETDADYILRFFAHIDGSPMLSAWHEGQYDFGIEGIHVTGMFPGYYEASQGVSLYETTAQTGGAGVTDITEKTVPFTEEYRERYSDAEEPPTQAPMYMGFTTYDSIFIASNVVNDTGEAPRSNLDGFVDRMLEVDYTGVAGQIQFYGPDSEYPHDLKETRDDEGDVLNFPITQWQDGGDLECVYPEAYRTAEHVKPEWMR